MGQTLYNAAGKKTSGQYWFWLDGMPLAQLNTNFAADGTISGSKLLYLHPDHLNTPRLATDSTQTLLWSWNSDAYGVGTPNEDVDGNGQLTTVNLRFPGQIYDATSQLSYNYFRDYNPDTGRVQSDPIGLEGGLNTYGYVGANPLSRTDSTGEFFFLAPLAEIAFDVAVEELTASAIAETSITVAEGASAVGTTQTAALAARATAVGVTAVTQAGSVSSIESQKCSSIM